MATMSKQRWSISWIRWTASWVVVCLGTAYASAQASAGTADDYSREGQRALAQGKYSEAEHDFEKLRELEPGVAEVHANLGLIYFQEGKFEQAVPTLRQALKLKPGLAKSASVLAMSLSELGRYEEALPGLLNGFRHSSDLEIKRMCGLELQRAYTGLKRDSKAVEIALELNRLYPEDPEILYQTSKVYGYYSFLMIEKLARIAPTSVWRHQATAEAYESQEQYNRAAAEYRRVLALEPNRPGVHYRLGRTLLALASSSASQDNAAAAKEFELELQLDPTYSNAAYELAEIQRKNGNFEQAQQLFERSLKNYPDFAEAHIGLAAVFTAQEKPELALPHLERAVEADPGNEVGWYRLAQVQRKLGNTAEVQKALTEFRRLHDISNQQHELDPVFSREAVTRQQLDANAVQ
jgi:tetratricopeptide (TPR) repeat protein